MNGLYSFCDLSVMQQAFWAGYKPSISCKITLVSQAPATKIGALARSEFSSGFRNPVNRRSFRDSR
jgi:hypothetical protein